MKINTGSILGEVIDECMDTYEASSLFKKGEISYSDYNNQIKHSIPTIVKTTIKNTAGASGIVMASDMAMNYYNIVMSGDSIGVGSYLSANSSSTALMGLCTSIYIMYSLADKYRDSLSYDAKNRVFHIEDLTKNIEINDINGVLNKRLTTTADYVYFRMMNRISTIDGFVDKGIGGITNSIKFIKDSFLSMRNFTKNISNKALSGFLEIKLIKKIIGNDYSDSMKKGIEEYFKLDYIDDFNKKFTKGFSSTTNDKTLHEKICKIAMNDHNNTRPSTLKKILTDKNEKALMDTYHVDMNQRLVLKFSKIVLESIRMKKIDIQNLSKFSDLAKMSTFKTDIGVMENDTHISISKMAKHLLNNTDDFFENNKKKSFVDIVRSLDNLMVKDDKVVFRGFNEIFYAIRDEKLNNKIYSNKNDLQKEIQRRIKGNKITEDNIFINNEIKNDETIWTKARAKMKKNNL